MTDEQDKPPDEDEYQVGYGRPPKHTRFRKGQTGNSRGRPRKKGSAAIEAHEILNGPITVVEHGKPHKMQAKEVELRQMLKKALAGDLSALVYLLKQFEKYGALERPEAITYGGVFRVPKTMPTEMGVILLQRFGLPPWNKRQLAAAREEFLADLSEEERKRDQQIYEDLRGP